MNNVNVITLVSLHLTNFLQKEKSQLEICIKFASFEFPDFHN